MLKQFYVTYYKNYKTMELELLIPLFLFLYIDNEISKIVRRI